MAVTRLDQLLQFYTEDPSDPFIIYGLALEYHKNDVKKSEMFFDKLLSEFTDYLPTYYHAAKLKIELGLHDSAKQIFLKGIELAKNQKNDITSRELQSAYEEFLFESEE